MLENIFDVSLTSITRLSAEAQPIGLKHGDSASQRAGSFLKRLRCPRVAKSCGAWIRESPSAVIEECGKKKVKGGAREVADEVARLTRLSRRIKVLIHCLDSRDDFTVTIFTAGYFYSDYLCLPVAPLITRELVMRPALSSVSSMTAPALSRTRRRVCPAELVVSDNTLRAETLPTFC